jgi:hypothetical protein
MVDVKPRRRFDIGHQVPYLHHARCLLATLANRTEARRGGEAQGLPLQYHQRSRIQLPL